jgi:murein DD-endopeptidase MepM/ murein hydrolase activator NlpD
VELQYHPASGRRTVTAVSLGPRGERVVIVLFALAALLAVSLWWTAPALLSRSARKATLAATAPQLPAARAADAAVRRRAAGLAERELAWADRLSRIAFLYGVPPARWPRVLDPARGVLASADAESLSDGLSLSLRGLERALELLAAREREDPELPARTPSIAPISGAVYEPAAFFGPRVSPWTGQEEFFGGLDLAAPEGSAVAAPADGRVVFVGRARRDRAPRLWQFGSLVVLSHGSRTATLFGHLARIDVKRGDRVIRGQRLGAVGRTGWALSPRLHYELRRREEGVWRPTDPLFAILDRRLDTRHRSLEQMLATSSPEPAEAVPGLP